MADLHHCQRYCIARIHLHVLVRILQRRGDVVEFAYLLVAVIHVVLMYSSNEITC
jgi:hypothetical protein